MAVDDVDGDDGGEGEIHMLQLHGQGAWGGSLRWTTTPEVIVTMRPLVGHRRCERYLGGVLPLLQASLIP